MKTSIALALALTSTAAAAIPVEPIVVPHVVEPAPVAHVAEPVAIPHVQEPVETTHAPSPRVAAPFEDEPNLAARPAPPRAVTPAPAWWIPGVPHTNANAAYFASACRRLPPARRSQRCRRALAD